MQIRFRIVTHPCWYPKSYLGLVSELLATTACTSYSNSLSGSVRFLESQLQAERHRSVVLRQEAEGLWKSLEHSDAYFLVQQQALEDFSSKQDKANQLAKLIASMVDTQVNISWALLKLFQLCSCFAAAFICTGGQFWRAVYVMCCFVPYICTDGELWCPVDVICVIVVIG